MGGNKSDIDFLYFHGFDFLTLIIVIYYVWKVSEKSNGNQAKFWFTLLCEVSFEKESQEKLMRSNEFTLLSEVSFGKESQEKLMSSDEFSFFNNLIILQSVFCFHFSYSFSLN